MAFQGLVDTNGTQIHADVYHILTLGHIGNPANILVCHQGIFIPGTVVETQADVIAQLIVAQQKGKAVVMGTTVHIVRTLPSQNMLGTFHHDALESHFCNHSANLIIVDKRAVTHNLGRTAEELLHLLGLALHFLNETFGIAH